MMMQISELVKAQGGLVLSRKETKASGNGGCPYKKADAPCIDRGWRNRQQCSGGLCASETLTMLGLRPLEML